MPLSTHTRPRETRYWLRSRWAYMFLQIPPPHAQRGSWNVWVVNNYQSLSRALNPWNVIHSLLGESLYSVDWFFLALVKKRKILVHQISFLIDTNYSVMHTHLRPSHLADLFSSLDFQAVPGRTDCKDSLVTCVTSEGKLNFIVVKHFWISLTFHW